MSVVWEHQAPGAHYQVRRAGGSIRLYTNGVFHSQWNPNPAKSRSVWDLLSLPVFYRQRAAPRVLVLGVGGGAVIKRLAEFKPDADIVGVDRDPVHLRVARSWFQVRCRLSRADAVEWVSHYRGEPFDVIVDDLFGHVDGVACRAVVANQVWLRRLRGLLVADGVLTVNHASVREWRDNVALTAGMPHRRRFSLPLYDNVIGVYSRVPLRVSQWRRAVADCSHLPAQQRRFVARCGHG
ncbi:MAG: methyltransferase domain-containing protein [Pseudomonadota bacterium]